MVTAERRSHNASAQATTPLVSDRTIVGTLANCAPGIAGEIVGDPHMLASITRSPLRAHATGMPLLDAQADFSRARRAYAIARIGRWLTPQPRQRMPVTIPAATMLSGGPARLEVVRLRAIVGTVDPTPHFDAWFRPASEAVRYRWERIALAHRRGVALPPITLRKQPDGYYIVDGRHRVSVARALGHRDIDAWVTGIRAPTSTQTRPGSERKSSSP